MEWLWLLAATASLLALAAVATTRRLSRRLTRLAEQYWELKYEHGELKARVRALAPTVEEIAASTPAVPTTFIPMSALGGRKSKG